MARTRHQEGSVKEHGNQWQGHYYVYDGDGKRHHKSVPLGPRAGGDKLSKWQAKEKLREIVDRETGKPIARKEAVGEFRDGTVGWYWLTRFAPFQPWSPRTRKSVEGMFRLHVLPRIGKTTLADVEKFQVQTTLQQLDCFSHSLVRKCKGYLKSMMETAIGDGFIRRNPVSSVKAIGGKPSTKRFLTIQEFDLIMGELRFRDRLICHIAFVEGLRPAELFALKWDDFDPGQRRLRIDETFAYGEWKPTKTRRSNGWVTMPTDIIREIQMWRELSISESPLMFPTRNGTGIDTRNFLEHVLKPAARRAGIMPQKPAGLPKWTRWNTKEVSVTFQSMRRACATHLQNLYGDIKATQSHLRHDKPQTTLEYYIEAVPEATQAAVDKLSAAVKRQPVQVQPVQVQPNAAPLPVQ